MSSRAALYTWEDEDIEVLDQPALEVLGGAGSGNFGHGGRPGERGGSTSEGGKDSERVARAVATHKPSTRDRQQKAERSAKVVAKLLGGQHTDDHQPMDVVVRTPNGLRGVEVKTLLDNTNHKITMHPESLARKVEWVREHKAEGHTIAVDRRGSTPKYYHREGFGSFRINTMTRVSAHELKSIVYGRKKAA